MLIFEKKEIKTSYGLNEKYEIQRYRLKSFHCIHIDNFFYFIQGNLKSIIGTKFEFILDSSPYFGFILDSFISHSPDSPILHYSEDI
jgi:hypothetical protein